MLRPRHEVIVVSSDDEGPTGPLLVSDEDDIVELVPSPIKEARFKALRFTRPPSEPIEISDDDDIVFIASTSALPRVHTVERSRSRVPASVNPGQSSTSRASTSSRRTPAAAASNFVAAAVGPSAGPSGSKRRQPEYQQSSTNAVVRKKARVHRETEYTRPLADMRSVASDFDSDSEEGYTYHAGYDMVSGNWATPPRALFVTTRERRQHVPPLVQLAATASEESNNVPSSSNTALRELAANKAACTRTYSKSTKKRIWDYEPKSRAVNDLRMRPEKSTPPGFIRPLAAHRYRPNLFIDMNYHTLRLSKQIKEASGTTTKIIQRHDVVAVASAASGGGLDFPDERETGPDPYNHEGNLLLWEGQTMVPVDAHVAAMVLEVDGAPREFHKFYTVNDIAFDPTDTTVFVSSGNDCKLNTWGITHDPGESLDVRLEQSLTYRRTPGDLVFRPNTSVLGVASHDGCIYIHPNVLSQIRHRIPLGTPRSCSDQPFRTGAFAWGNNNMIYASTESDDDKVKCPHVAIDVEERKIVHSFGVTQSGDALALDAQMKRLALVTNTSKHHSIGIHDTTSGSEIHRMFLFHPKETSFEVNHASFSPDGVFLALARSDDIINVYDTRFMDKELYTFEQPGRSYTNYGVVAADWIYGPRGGLGLVTGGSDGCVRLWDLNLAADDRLNGRAMIQVDNGIACMSMGDPMKGEHRFVVGDEGGKIYFYD